MSAMGQANISSPSGNCSATLLAFSVFILCMVCTSKCEEGGGGGVGEWEGGVPCGFQSCSCEGVC